jgi:hypothetical protein
MAVAEGKKRIFVTLGNWMLSKLEATAQLTGINKSELVERALVDSQEITELFRDPKVGQAAQEVQYEIFLELIAEQEGPEVAEALRQESRQNMPPPDSLSFAAKVHLLRRKAESLEVKAALEAERQSKDGQ